VRMPFGIVRSPRHFEQVPTKGWYFARTSCTDAAMQSKGRRQRCEPQRYYVINAR
jgi:hypothetical protein